MIKQYLRDAAVVATVFLSGALTVDYHWWAGLAAFVLLLGIVAE